MAPGLITPTTSASDVDLTSKAIEHKLEKINAPSKLAELDASKLTYTLTKNPRPVPDEATACGGTETICSDHSKYESLSCQGVPPSLGLEIFRMRSARLRRKLLTHTSDHRDLVRLHRLGRP
jgi:hypothetical protein